MRLGSATASAFNFPVLHKGQQGRDIVELDLHFAADDAHGHGAGALVRHVQHFHAGRLREQHHRQMAEIADAGGAVGDAVGFLLGQRDQLGDGVRRQRRIGRQHSRQPHRGRHRHEILQRIVGQILVEPGIDRHRRVGGEAERVAVRIGLLERRQAHGAVGAAAVLDEDRLAQQLRQMIRHHPRDEIGAAAGRETARSPGSASAASFARAPAPR